ncbi:thrombospondin type 3 repeat-containing protein [Solimonas marina]|uniref:Thrombospondin type 3 repeat-containing protein n=1 Tax=Solimonas marina TaxID=2714601 RepID=A0A969WBG3_9GAMM|nr:thrombospondin type 3 repeat-containing protein [Solimonas marina]NKF23892.1 hypothetical protein [Solimonas marina]
MFHKYAPTLVVVLALAACAGDNEDQNKQAAVKTIQVPVQLKDVPESLRRAIRPLSAKAADDADGDGVVDAQDAFPEDPSEFLDSNGNGVGNFADADEDGDGVPDVQDAFPLDTARSVEVVVEEVEPKRIRPRQRP